MPKPKENINVTSYDTKDILTFLIPSLIGILLFIVPIKQDGGITIPVAFLAG
ncbi:YjiH family protein, partial [Planococcus sp. SIMBA_143]